MANYIESDGDPGSVAELNFTVRCLAVAAGLFVREGEGILIDLSYQEKVPSAVHGHFIVFHEDGQMKIREYHNDKFKHGQAVYIGEKGEVVFK